MKRHAIILLFSLLPLLSFAQSFTAENLSGRGVQLSWTAIEGEVQLDRMFATDDDWQPVTVTEASFYEDHFGHTYCDDTVNYRLRTNTGTLLARTHLCDDLPTTEPYFNICTVDPATQRITLIWERSPDSDIWGYILFRRNDTDGPWLPFDTIWSATATQREVDDDPLQQHFYRVNAFDSCLTTSAMAVLRANMVLTHTFDPDAHTIDLQWTDYFYMEINDYRIELKTFVNDRPITPSYTDVGITNSHTLTVSDNVTRAEVTIIAVEAQGNARPRSNRVECTFNIPTPPPPPDPPSEPDPEPEPEPEYEPATVWIPTAFTPDEVANRQLCVVANHITAYHLTIYNRMGLRVFHSTDPALCWDGRLPSGEKAPQGVYTYALHFTDLGHRTHHRGGTVLLIR